TQRLSAPEKGDRVAAAWLGPDSMLGAEHNTLDLGWWDQFHAATAHWRREDGSLGWLRARVPGVSDTTVEPGRLTLRWHHDSDEHHGDPGDDDTAARFLLDRPHDEHGDRLRLTTTGPPLSPAPDSDGSVLVARPDEGSITTFTIALSG
ncbi:MAG: hypothetical protein WKF43_13385, partial [Acidimicrobiales bacterium]